MTVAVGCLLAVAVLSVWFGCCGFLRFKTALERLHCAAFVNVVAGAAVTVAVLLQDGLTPRSLKMLAILAVQLAVGAATMHAIGRAVMIRGGSAK